MYAVSKNTSESEPALNDLFGFEELPGDNSGIRT
jgi:hypothetical protein